MNRNLLYLLVFLGYSFINSFGNETLKTKPGRSVEMKCPKNGETERLIWFYRKNNTGNEVRVRESKHVKIYSNEQENILVLENPTYSDEGLYVLRRIGQDNNARCQKYLEILSPPSAHCSPLSPLTAEKGTDVTLICKSERGNPRPFPTWYRLEGSSAKRQQLVKTSELTIKNITRYATGVYECNLRNTEGEDNCSISVTIKFKPEIEVYENIIELRDIRNATLMCRVTANPMSAVVWTKDNNTEKLYSNHLYNIEVDNELLQTHYTTYIILTLNALTLKENIFGVYWCRITGYGKEYARKVKVLRITDAT